MNDLSPRPDLSVIVPVGERHANAEDLYAEYRQGVESTGLKAEFIFVIDGPHADFAAAINAIARRGEPITIVSLTKQFGEATALMAGFEQARAEVILTLPGYFQIESSGIPALVGAVGEADLVVAHRWPRVGSPLEKLRRSAFHSLLRSVTGQSLRDLGCGARAMKRGVLEEITLYGDQHRFLPILADRQGFRIREVDVPQSAKDRFKGVYQPQEYARRGLDIFTVFFLARFTKKPLRFFGMVGVTTFVIGALLVTYLVIDRLFFGHGLADRPALLLSSLLVVLGLQVFALGLLGELIIFTHARDIRDYKVDRVIHFDPEYTPLPRASDGTVLKSGAN